MLPSLIRIQPVAPDQPSWPQLFGNVVAAFVLLPISGLFLMLGMGAAHELWPSIPVAGYWQSVWLVAGLGTVGHVVKSHPFKWHRR